MQKEPHTPGPWRWRSVSVDGKTHCFLESTLPPEQVPWRDVTVFALREDWAGTFADTSQPARWRRQWDRDLIAAAPALAKALQAMVAYHDSKFPVNRKAALDMATEALKAAGYDRGVVA